PDGFMDVQAGFTVTGRHTAFTDVSERWHKPPAAVRLRGVRDTLVRDVRFTRTGAAALTFEDRSLGDRVERSRFDDIGGTAIQLGQLVAGNAIARQPHRTGAIYLDEGTAGVTVRDNAFSALGTVPIFDNSHRTTNAIRP